MLVFRLTAFLLVLATGACRSEGASIISNDDIGDFLESRSLMPISTQQRLSVP